MHPVLRLVDDLVAFIDAEAHGDYIADNQDNTELPDVLERGVDIFEMSKHGF
jgi:hypothetical protein